MPFLNFEYEQEPITSNGLLVRVNNIDIGVFTDV